MFTSIGSAPARLSLVLCAAVVTASPAFAQSTTASVIIIHGLPGGDLQQPAALPVDISVDGACALTNVNYRTIVGPLSIPAGTRSIAVHYPATGSCSSAAAIGPAAVPFNGGESATIIAHVGANGAPTASKFVNNLSATPTGRSRVAVHHTANAPAVDIYLTRAFGSADRDHRLDDRPGAERTDRHADPGRAPAAGHHGCRIVERGLRTGRSGALPRQRLLALCRRVADQPDAGCDCRRARGAVRAR